jgi:serine/threonine protein phosphatase PrpC
VQERVEVVLSPVHLRRGDVALLCSDGLHGPVADEEILAILIAESNLQKAGEALIQKALDRDGPDNITVVLGRFDGEGLQPPTAEDVVTFVGYDPGGDPVPEGLSAADSASLARETVEERLPRDMLTSDDIPTKAEPDDPEPTAGHRKPQPRSGRSLLALFLLAVVAAATGGIFVMKCEHDPSSKITLP